jgi:lipoprotein NlpD
MRYWVLGICVLFVSGCQFVQQHPAPVVRLDMVSFQPGKYVAKPGDTIYAIAWRYHLDYEALARANHIKAPYALKPGQVVRLTEVSKTQKDHVEVLQIGEREVYKRTGVKKSLMKKIDQKVLAFDRRLNHGWLWPVQGRLTETFNLAKRHNGLTFSVAAGAKVFASAAGVVVYVGDAISGYGHLILIKHSRSLMSAYAGDQHAIRKVGETIRRGEVIAYAKQQAGALIHFELRVNGKPRNPLHYLAKKKVIKKVKAKH